jgi:hypothetical protein
VEKNLTGYGTQETVQPVYWMREKIGTGYGRGEKVGIGYGTEEKIGTEYRTGEKVGTGNGKEEKIGTENETDIERKRGLAQVEEKKMSEQEQFRCFLMCLE